jgi:hypothetical protein
MVYSSISAYARKLPALMTRKPRRCDAGDTPV